MKYFEFCTNDIECEPCQFQDKRWWDWSVHSADSEQIRIRGSLAQLVSSANLGTVKQNQTIISQRFGGGTIHWVHFKRSHNPLYVQFRKKKHEHFEKLGD